jgi:hypothetical protein
MQHPITFTAAGTPAVQTIFGPGAMTCPMPVADEAEAAMPLVIA